MALGRNISLLLTVVALSGCASNLGDVGQDKLAEVNTTLPSREHYNGELKAIEYSSADAQRWWTVFEDQSLSTIVELAKENATDVQLAVTRLDEAFALARASRQRLLPSLDLRSQAGIDSVDLEQNGFRTGPNRTNTAALDLTLTWQADLFGELKAANSATKLRLQASQAEVRDVQRLVVAQVVTGYFRVAGIRERITVAQESLSRRRDSRARINQLLEKGHATSLDKSRTDNQFYQANAALAQLKLDETTLVNQMSIIVGVDLDEVRSLLGDANKLADVPANAVIPSVEMLLKHRPDLRRVERELVAAAYERRSAKRALYPTLGLSAGIGKGAETVGINVGEFPNLNVITGNILANLTMPIIGRGQILSQINASSARLSAAHIRFEDRIRRALQGIDNALASLSHGTFIAQQRLHAAESATTAAELSKELYLAGEIDYTSVIVAEDTRAAAEDFAIVAGENALSAYIQYTSSVAPVW